MKNTLLKRNFPMLAKPGTYALILHSPSAEVIRVGKLGQLQIQSGFYIYVGSAFGPGGLRARISHHRHISNHPRWHIDYLRAVTCLQGIWYTYDSIRREHQWAEVFVCSKRASIPFGGFGSSDCRCQAHLTYYQSQPSFKSFSRKIHARYRDHGKIYFDKSSGPSKVFH